MSEAINLKKYILLFVITNLIGAIIIGAVLIFFELNGSAGAGIGILFAGSYVAIHKFIMDNARPPNKPEKIRLIIYSAIFHWLTSLLLLLTYLLIFWMIYPKEFQQILALLSFLRNGGFPVFIILLGIVFDLIITVLVLWLNYGFLARKLHEMLEKKGKI